MRYKISVTDEQAGIIQEALEIYARLGIGQFRDALEEMPLKDQFDAGWHDDMHAIGSILKKHMKRNIDGWQSSLGITSSDVSSDAQMAWDMYQVVRKKMAWKRAVENGIVKSETSERDWSKMMQVSYDDVMQVGPGPLAEIEDDG